MDNAWRDTVNEDDFEWTGEMELPKLAALRIAPEFSGRSVNLDIRSNIIQIEGENEDGDGVTDEQQAAIGFLQKHEDVVVAKILEALSETVRRQRAGGGWEGWDGPGTIDDVMPRDMNPQKAATRIEIDRVLFSSRSRNGMAYIEIYGEGAWDPEHGFYAVFQGERLVDCGQQGSGWEDKTEDDPAG